MLKTTIFCQTVLTGIWSLNSNCSLIAFLPATQNLPGLLVHFGISKDVNQYIFIFTEIRGVLRKKKKKTKRKKEKHLPWDHVGKRCDCGRTQSPIKCNYSLTPFAHNSPHNEVAYGLCLQGHRQEDGLVGRFTNFNSDLPESSAL